MFSVCELKEHLSTRGYPSFNHNPSFMVDLDFPPPTLTQAQTSGGMWIQPLVALCGGPIGRTITQVGLDDDLY